MDEDREAGMMLVALLAAGSLIIGIVLWALLEFFA